MTSSLRELSNADGFSHLPPSTVEEIFTLLMLCYVVVQRGTRNDPKLSKVHDITVQGWPAHGNLRFPLFYVLRRIFENIMELQQCCEGKWTSDGQ